jgi:hypothetical protein
VSEDRVEGPAVCSGALVERPRRGRLQNQHVWGVVLEDVRGQTGSAPRLGNLLV